MSGKSIIWLALVLGGLSLFPLPGKAAIVATVKLKLVNVDSAETNGENGYGENALDGNPNTIWHTQWQSSSPGLPHEIVIELIPPATIKGFSYLPRQDESDHGTIKGYEFYVSNDGKHFGQPVSKGIFGPGKKEKVETFEPVKCRFIKLKAISEINGLPFTSAAEIRVIQVGENASPKNYWRGDVGPAPVPQDSTRLDAIDSMIAAFSKYGDLWMNGIDAFDGSQAGSPEEVISETFRKAKFQNGLMTSYRILDVRKVRMDELDGDYTAALVDTNLGQMIVLMRKSATPGQWWRRIYSAGAPYNRLY
ncbi:MAG TPA: discoidin domain-containing protein [Pseudomonadales bacterium]|nr:discoidin domain-containing protein [Pseudomonadales bacterium]